MPAGLNWFKPEGGLNLPTLLSYKVLEIIRVFQSDVAHSCNIIEKSTFDAW